MDPFNLNNQSMHSKSETFFSKILLFGEYSVIFGSMGLAVPYPHFRGRLRFPEDRPDGDDSHASESNRQLKLFAENLRGMTDQKGEYVIETDRLENDIRQGLYFDSSIPQGYGVGSSGALCAAIYHQYGIHPILPGLTGVQKEAKALQELFSMMESYFHGQSSGLDPLLCYIRQPILIREDKQVEIVRLPGEPSFGNIAVFLADTGVSGKTGPLVKLFRDKAGSGEYLDFIQHQLIPVTHDCIHSFLNDRPADFFEYLKQLSRMQLEHFREMIPVGFTRMWKTGLDTGDYYLKLCGSGGGGFLLGMAPDPDRARIRLKEYDIAPIPVF